MSFGQTNPIYLFLFLHPLLHWGAISRPVVGPDKLNAAQGAHCAVGVKLEEDRLRTGGLSAVGNGARGPSQPGSGGSEVCSQTGYFPPSFRSARLEGLAGVLGSGQDPPTPEAGGDASGPWLPDAQV